MVSLAMFTPDAGGAGIFLAYSFVPKTMISMRMSAEGAATIINRVPSVTIGGLGLA